jgi:hypothetical protein
MLAKTGPFRDLVVSSSFLRRSDKQFSFGLVTWNLNMSDSVAGARQNSHYLYFRIFKKPESYKTLHASYLLLHSNLPKTMTQRNRHLLSTETGNLGTA